MGCGASTDAKSGRDGLIRIATTLPRMAPTPFADRMSAHGPAPPRLVFAISGPSTAQQPTQNMFEMPKTKTVDQSQVWEVNFPPPGAELAEVAFPRCLVLPRRDADAGEEQRADREGDGIERERDTGAAERDERPADRRSEHSDDVP